jgi:serine/threonine protein phosphatase PrpC
MELNTTVIQATIRGDKDESIPNQDYIEIFENKDLMVTVVSDGLGSSKSSLEGAMIACRTVIAEMQNFHHFHEISILGYRIQQNWTNIIGKKAGTPVEYRTTNSFVAVFKKEKKIIVGQLGDVLVSLRIDGLFRYLQSTSKDFSNETDCLGSGRDEHFNLAIYEFGHSFDFLIATDGVADELLTEKIEPFHDYLKSKFQNIEMELRNDVLKNEIVEFINEKNNDDKSLIFIWSNKV